MPDRTDLMQSHKMTLKRLASYLFLVASLSTLAACVGTPETLPSPKATRVPLVDSKQMVDEYKTTVASFPEALPEGIEFASAIPKDFDLAGKSEPGVGMSFAYFYWVCAWQAEFIQAHEVGDAAQEAQALNALERWKLTDFYATHFDDPQDLWTERMIEPARAGDPTELINYFNSGCSYYVESNR